jgi:isopentenyldiphosphate isomerase
VEPAEYVDILDEEGRVVGQELRSRCHGDPTLRHRAVHVFVRSTQGQIFLQKRAQTKSIQPGKWDTSVGGHLEVGENYEDGALRELREELGVNIQDTEGASSLRRLHDYIWRSLIETEHIRTFEIVWDGPFQIQRDEIDEGKFWPRTEICASLGKGILTPNLEEEIRLLGIC